jgi:hypothetical protein
MPCDLVPCMAMTLDDGPSTLTPTFLDVLRDEQSAATFFMPRKNAERHPDTVARVAAEGHEIGNHTWDHAYLTDLTDARVQAELRRHACSPAAPVGAVDPVLPPPGGFVNEHVVALAGQSAILWSVDTRDWAGPAAADLRATRSIRRARHHHAHARHPGGHPERVPRRRRGPRDRGFHSSRSTGCSAEPSRQVRCGTARSLSGRAHGVAVSARRRMPRARMPGRAALRHRVPVLGRPLAHGRVVALSGALLRARRRSRGRAARGAAETDRPAATYGASVSRKAAACASVKSIS